MDRGTVSTTMRARKVTYDEYTGAFFVETRVEALERQVATRAKMTDVLNRSAETKLELRKKRDKSALDIFERKLDKEGHQHKESLKDHVAHYNVLQELAKERAVSRKTEENMGSYGLGTSKLEIQPLIQKKIQDSTPSAKRKRQSKKILGGRRNIKLFDRTKTTSALLRMRDQINSRPLTSEETKSEGARKGEGHGKSGSPSKLILPPISVRWTRHQLEPGVASTGQTIETNQPGTVFNSVFITDLH